MTFPREKLELVAGVIRQARDNGKQIFVFGNGGSGAAASHFACDLNKGATVRGVQRTKVICLNDNVPTILAYANDVSYADIFVEQLKNFLMPGDLVFGISGSGNSENVLKAISYAKEFKAETIGLTGFDGGRLAGLAQISLVVPSHDMQIVEDLHLVALHILMRKLLATG